jgi:diguanylate cyclase with GGDEF domain
VERQITISIGIAAILDHAGDADGLLREADRALYTAKQRGRNRIEVAVSSGAAAARRAGSQSQPSRLTCGHDQHQPAQVSWPYTRIGESKEPGATAHHGG